MTKKELIDLIAKGSTSNGGVKSEAGGRCRKQRAELKIWHHHCDGAQATSSRWWQVTPMAAAPLASARTQRLFLNIFVGKVRESERENFVKCRNIRKP